MSVDCFRLNGVYSSLAQIVHISFNSSKSLNGGATYISGEITAKDNLNIANLMQNL